jgi:photosystem II stability/assembly factor-like uncharacterized protein
MRTQTSIFLLGLLAIMIVAVGCSKAPIETPNTLTPTEANTLDSITGDIVSDQEVTDNPEVLLASDDLAVSDELP